MPRPSEEDKLSISEVARLRDSVTRGISAYGSAKAFGEAINVRAPVISLARHGRLVARTKSALAILDFELAATHAATPPPASSKQHDSDPEVMALIGRLTRGTDTGKRQLVRMLKAAAALQSGRPFTQSTDDEIIDD